MKGWSSVGREELGRSYSYPRFELTLPPKLRVSSRGDSDTDAAGDFESKVGDDMYNNFYEFGTDKGDPSKNSKEFSDLAVDGFRRRGSKQAAQVHDGRNPEAGAAGGAHLPAPLRRGMVDRRAVDRVFRSACWRILVEPHPESEYMWPSKAISIRSRCLCGAARA